jgi:uncharacterized protein (TIGR02391 family)
MQSNWMDVGIEILSKLHKAITAMGALAVMAFSIYGGLSSDYPLSIGILVGIIGAMLIVGTYAFSGIWSLTLDSLSDFLSKYPKLRRSIILIFILSVFIFVLIVIFYSGISIFFKLALGIFVLTLCPPALFSLIQEDRRRESFKLLGDFITPELIAQSPQAAIEHAFTIFEDRLRNRVGADQSLYGESLINLAFGQDGKLSYSVVENENKGVRNLISGVYATYRNPRKHRVIKDDKESALAIIALIELLIHITDDSTKKE